MSAVYVLIRLSRGGGAFNMGFRSSVEEAEAWADAENADAQRLDLPWSASYRRVS